MMTVLAIDSAEPCKFGCAYRLVGSDCIDLYPVITFPSHRRSVDGNLRIIIQGRGMQPDRIFIWARIRGIMQPCTGRQCQHRKDNLQNTKNIYIYLTHTPNYLP